jgi:hypothetical protein
LRGLSDESAPRPLASTTPPSTSTRRGPCPSSECSWRGTIWLRDRLRRIPRRWRRCHRVSGPIGSLGSGGVRPFRPSSWAASRWPGWGLVDLEALTQELRLPHARGHPPVPRTVPDQPGADRRGLDPPSVDGGPLAPGHPIGAWPLRSLRRHRSRPGRVPDSGHPPEVADAGTAPNGPSHCQCPGARPVAGSGLGLSSAG